MPGYYKHAFEVIRETNTSYVAIWIVMLPKPAKLQPIGFII
jgi:hypothetical protein